MDLTATAALGSIVGLAMGLGGAGGGSLSVATLALCTGSSLQACAPLALCASGLSSSFGAAASAKRARWGRALLICICSMPAAAAARLASAHLPSLAHQMGFALALGAAFLLGSKSLALTSAASRAPGAEPPRSILGRPAQRLALCAMGALAGCAAGLFGVGGGFVLVPALSRWGGVQPEEIAPTALAAAAATASAALIPALASGLPWPSSTIGTYCLCCACCCALSRMIAPRLPALVQPIAFKCAVGAAALCALASF